MHRIKTLLTEKSTIVPVWFNAWRYEREEHLVVPMLDVLREALQHWAATKETETSEQKAAVTAAATMARAGRALLAGFKMSGKLIGVDVEFEPSKVLEDWEKNDDKAAGVALSFYHASFNAMKKAVADFSNQGAHRIVIFVDDLDRCLPISALEVLESMKLLFDLAGFIFVVGLNKDIIERSIQLKYHTPGLQSDEVQPIKGTDYVKKIFQVPFGLPQISTEQMQGYFYALVSDSGLPPAQQNDLQQVVQPHLEYLSEDGSLNPREVKRFINAYTLQLKMLKPKLGPALDPNVILALQVMNFRPAWFDLYDAMAEDPAVFQQSVQDAVNSAAGGTLDLRGNQVALPRDFVTYVQEPFVHGLLTENLEVYLSSSESTRSSAPGPAERARRNRQSPRADRGSCDGRQSDTFAGAVKSSLSVIEQETTSRTGPLIEQIKRDVKDIEHRFSSPEPFPTSDDRQRWVSRTRAALDLVDQNVTELRRQASFGRS